MKPIAVLCSDLHLSHNPPVARSVEPSWYEAMQRPLDEMRDLAQTLNVPIICGGDVLDKPIQPPEFISWAIDHIPFMYSIWGQHDTFSHRADQLYRSTYSVLAKIGVIQDLGHNEYGLHADTVWCYSFPWGVELRPTDLEEYEGCKKLAVVHHYVWKGTKHPGARDEDQVDSIIQQLSGFDAIVTGDNHNGFIHKNLINCGTFIRRKADERQLKPMIGILHNNGHIEPHYLDCSQDKFLDDDKLASQAEELQTDLSEFIQGLRELGVDSLDFRQAVSHKMQELETDQDVRELVMETLL